LPGCCSWPPGPKSSTCAHAGVATTRAQRTASRRTTTFGLAAMCRRDNGYTHRKMDQPPKAPDGMPWGTLAWCRVSDADGYSFIGELVQTRTGFLARTFAFAD